MAIGFVLLAMVLVGLLMGWLAGIIWKGERPFGVQNDYIISVVAAVLIGLLDWFVIPAMGFSNTMKYLGIALEPALSSLLVLWIARQVKR